MAATGAENQERGPGLQPVIQDGLHRSMQSIQSGDDSRLE
jgi:hypothetical protein